MSDEEETKKADPRQELRDLLDLAEKQAKEREVCEAAQPFRFIDDPGEVMFSLVQQVGIIDGLSYELLKKNISKRPWVWQHNARPLRGGKAFYAIEFAFEHRETGVQFRVTKEFRKDTQYDDTKKHEWDLMGESDSYQEFAAWLAGRLGLPSLRVMNACDPATSRCPTGEWEEFVASAAAGATEAQDEVGSEGGGDKETT